MQQLQCLQYREVNIASTRFVQRFLRFYRPQTAQKIPPKFRLKNIILLHTYNPAFCGLCQGSWATLLPTAVSMREYLNTRTPTLMQQSATLALFAISLAMSITVKILVVSMAGSL